MPWRGVVQWLADSADLALHVDKLPTGSFTYSDSRSYTADQAISRINMFLIPKRHSMVRSGKLLSVIDLDDVMSVRQLDSMADLVSVGELKNRGSHDLVKCLFPLGDIAAEQALEELSGLMLIREPVSMRNTNRLLVTDTAGKLQMVEKILKTLERPDAAAGPVKRFQLAGLDPEQVLEQVRPHVGLDPLAMTGADIRLSVDHDRGQILASGSIENLAAIAAVLANMQAVVVPAQQANEQPFRPHDVGGADIQAVVNVLQTLLADEYVRMAPDLKSNKIAIMGSEAVHDLVERTIQQFTRPDDPVEFKAIPVTSIDPLYAAIVLNEMFAPATTESGEAAGQENAPKIDADPRLGRLFVRARKSQIAAIELALKQFGPPALGRDSTLRLLPYRGARASRVLEWAHEFWPYADQLQILPPALELDPQPLERETNPEPPANASPSRERHFPGEFEATDHRKNSPQPNGNDFTQRNDLEPPADERNPARIIVKQTPRGLLVHSDDLDALERFETLVQLIAGPVDAQTRRLAIFYLEHATVADANLLLQRLLDAETYSTPYSRLSGTAAENRQLLRSVSLAAGPQAVPRGGMWTAGDVSVIPDERLNRLFVFGAATHLAKVERHLEVIDRENSIAQIKTYGAPRVISLNHARAETVAGIIRDAYSGRIAASAKERNQAAALQNERRSSQSPDSQDQNRRRSRNSPRQNRPAPASERPKMTLAVDSQSNSLIVTAPKQLADEVEALAGVIDEQGAREIRVFRIRGVNAAPIREALRNLYGGQLQFGSRGNSSGVSTNPRQLRQSR